MQHLLLATAGHIDHGKTSLVQALTGVDTDRLPEERRRKITIDLGFAPLEIGNLSIGIVDVPGHERFVKNMLAGAAGVDLAMLVIAADDSVKPQTREHLDILKHLMLQSGIVAITKCDLVEEDWLELVESEVRELLDDTFLTDAPLIRVSTRTGIGIDALREAIKEAATRISVDHRKRNTRPFRMAIDRVFTSEGHGTIATGSVASGQVSVGDELEVQPLGKVCRVRGLQSHSKPVETIGPSQRAAINLTGVDHNALRRGQTLATAGTLCASRVLTARLALNDQLVRPLKDRSEVRLHIGSGAVACRVLLVGKSELERGETGNAQLLVSEPVAAVWGQPFVIRRITPVETLGGGQVTDPQAKKLRRRGRDDLRPIDRLASCKPQERAAASAFLRGTQHWRPSDWPTVVGIDAFEDVLESLLKQGTIVQLNDNKLEPRFLHTEVYVTLKDRIGRVLQEQHQARPLRSFVERSRLTRQFGRVPPELLDGICVAMEDAGLLRICTAGLQLASWTPQLTDRQRQLFSAIKTSYATAKFRPGTIDQVAEELHQPVHDVAELAVLGVETGELTRISKDFLLDSEEAQKSLDLIETELSRAGQMTVSQIRELLDTSRKFAVPFCEYLDTIGLTRRQGDMRRLVRDT